MFGAPRGYILRAVEILGLGFSPLFLLNISVWVPNCTWPCIGAWRHFWANLFVDSQVL